MSTKFLNLSTKICIGILIFCLSFSLCFLTINVAQASSHTTKLNCTTSCDMFAVTFKGYNNGTIDVPFDTIGYIKYTIENFFMGDDYNGPIGIVKAKLNRGYGGEDVYVIALSGTEIIHSNETGLQSTGAITDLLAFANISNPFSRAVVKAIKNNIPKNSKLLFYGHSLGGMVAQQVIATKDIKKNYNVINTVTYGSPMICYFSKREGNVVRLCDKRDLVPAMSIYTFSPLFYKQFFGKERKTEDAGYKLTETVLAHNESYVRLDVWGDYDVLGNKGGKAKLDMDYADMKYFDAPIYA